MRSLLNVLRISRRHAIFPAPNYESCNHSCKGLTGPTLPGIVTLLKHLYPYSVVSFYSIISLQTGYFVPINISDHIHLIVIILKTFQDSKEVVNKKEVEEYKQKIDNLRNYVSKLNLMVSQATNLLKQLNEMI